MKSPRRRVTWCRAAVGPAIALLLCAARVSLAAQSPSCPDAGIEWQEVKGNPVLSGGHCFSWRCAGVTDPTLIREPDNSVKLWFTTMGIHFGLTGFAADGPWTGRLTGNISPENDLHVVPEAPVVPVGQKGSWDRYVETPVVRRDEAGKLRMWYLGYRAKGGRFGFLDPAIGEMRSADAGGTKWNRAPEPIYRPKPGAWDGALVTGPSVLQGPDRVWRLYYSGIGTANGIGLLTSTDGEHWRPFDGNPVFKSQPGAWDDEILEQAVVYYRHQYWMWYSGWRGELKPDTRISIGLATSADGLHWTRYSKNPVITPGAKGSWDDLRILAPDVAAEPDGSLLMVAYGSSEKDIGKAAGAIGFWRSVSCR